MTDKDNSMNARPIEFSMTIKKASFDPATNEMRWRAECSDIDSDSYGDSMSLQLFDSFLHRVEADELPPMEYRSKFWSGGMPYLSVSHYPDLDGSAVPGPVDAVWVDGRFFKAKGRFFDTPLGKACFKSLKMDRKVGDTEHPIRISIAFLDYSHEHKENGYLFVRNMATGSECPECEKAYAEGRYSPVTYLDGHLVHLAMTRVPVNKRTSMEVDKSMTTRKEDAASIVGNELADEISEKAELVGKSEALVVRGEDEEVVEETPEAVPDPILEAIKAMTAQIAELSEVVRASYSKKEEDAEDEECDDEMTEEGCGKKKKEAMKSEATPEPEPEPEPQEALVVTLTRAFSEALSPLTQKMDILIQAQSARPVPGGVPAKRSIDPNSVPQTTRSMSAVDPNKPMSIRELAWRSTASRPE